MIAKILAEEYGVGIVAAPVYAVLWAAESIANTAEAKQALAEANKIRQKHGVAPACPEYGSRLF